MNKVSDQTVGNISKRHRLPPRTGAKKDRDVARVHSLAQDTPGCDRFLYRRGLDDVWVGDLLLEEHNHQGRGKVLLRPLASQEDLDAQSIRTRDRRGGLLKYYDYKAA